MTDTAVSTVETAPCALRIAEPRLFAAGQIHRAALFARRVMAFNDVRSLAIDPVSGCATLNYVPPAEGAAAFIRRLADAVRGGAADLPAVDLPPWRDGAAVMLRRGFGMVTAVQVVAVANGRLAVCHKTLAAEPEAARRVEQSLRAAPGVFHAGARGNSVRVHYDAGIVAAAVLVRLIEIELALPPPLLPPPPVPDEPGFALANLSVGIAAAGEIVLPALAPLAAVTLILTNLAALRGAVRELRGGRVGLPVLYGCILAMTLATGQFLSAALMFWFFRFWQARHRQDLIAGHRDLLDACMSLPARARAVTADGQERLVPVSVIDPGQRLLVSAGETIPADAAVTAGCAWLDETFLRGGTSPSMRTSGAEVLAGTRVLAGALALEVLRAGADTRAAAAAALMSAAAAPPPRNWGMSEDAENFADRFVGPMLLLAAAGLLVGGPVTAGAILRPDYATGPGLALPLETLRAAQTAAGHGALLCSPSALRRFNAGAWVILDDDPALHDGGCEIDGLRHHGMNEAMLWPAMAAAGAWLGDGRGAALARACRMHGHVVRRGRLQHADADSVTVLLGGRTLRLSGIGTRQDYPPLRIELDGAEIGAIRFRRGRIPAASATVEDLQRLGLRVFLATSEPPKEAARRARQLGINRFQAGMDQAATVHLLDGLERRGVTAIHVRQGEAERLAGPSHVSIACAPEAMSGHAGHDIVLMGQSIGAMPELADLARDSAAHAHRSLRAVVVPNLFCVAGALSFGLSGLSIVLLSNLGTALARRHARKMLRESAEDQVRFKNAAWLADLDAAAGAPLFSPAETARAPTSVREYA